jgi:hypothetical protein
VVVTARNGGNDSPPILDRRCCKVAMLNTVQITALEQKSERNKNTGSLSCRKLDKYVKK